MLDKEHRAGKNPDLIALLRHYVPEAVAVLNLGDAMTRRHSDITLHMTVPDLMGEHARIDDRSVSLAVDTFMQRLQHHVQIVVPAYHRYLQLKHEIASNERGVLRLESFKAQPLSSFVRNKLIDQAYLPIIGITAEDTPEQRDRCIEAGMDDCIAHTAPITALGKILKRWVSVCSHLNAQELQYIADTSQQAALKRA